MCRKCETGKALKQYDPAIESRIEWLLRMKHHLGLGIPRHELGVELSDLNDIYSVEIAMDRARAEAHETASAEHDKRMQMTARKGSARGVELRKKRR